MKPKNYPLMDAYGTAWRMDGSRPVSALADKVMADVSNPKRGGARKGAGAKKKKNTMVVLSMRVPKNQKARISKMVKDYLKLLNNPLLLNQIDNPKA